MSTNNINLDDNNPILFLKGTLDNFDKDTYLNFQFMDKSSGKQFYGYLYGSDLLTDNNIGDSFLKDIKLPKNLLSGENYILSSFSYSKNNEYKEFYIQEVNYDNGDRNWYWNEEDLEALSALGIDPDIFEFSVSGANQYTDEESLSFSNLSLSKDLVTTDNEIIILNAEINNLKYFDYLSIGFYNESDNSTISSYLSSEQLINKKDSKGKYFSNLSFSNSPSNGNYKLKEIYGSLNVSGDNQINIYRENYFDDDTNSYKLNPWDIEDLEELSSLGINPENLSFSINKNLKEEKDQEVLLDDISFESINIKDEINYIPKIFDIGAQNQKIILDIEIKETGIGLGNNNFLANELNSLQTLTGFFSNGRYNFSVNDQFLFYSLSEDFEYTNNNIGFLSLAGPSKQFRLLPLTSNDIQSTDTNKTKISREIILDSGMEPGEWRIDRFIIQDKAGNRYSSNNQYSNKITSAGFITLEKDDLREKKINTIKLANQLGIKSSDLVFEVENNSYKDSSEILIPQIEDIKINKSNFDKKFDSETKY